MSSKLGVQNIAHTNGTNAMTIASDGGVTFANVGGTWTPTITGESGTITSYTITSGSYTKIGNAIMARCRFAISNKGTGSNFVLTLPITATEPPLGIFSETNTTGLTGFLFNTSATATTVTARLAGWSGQALVNGNYTVEITYKG